MTESLKLPCLTSFSVSMMRMLSHSSKSSTKVFFAIIFAGIPGDGPRLSECSLWLISLHFTGALACPTLLSLSSEAQTYILVFPISQHAAFLPDVVITQDPCTELNTR